MGHAGAIVAGGKGTAAEKYQALEEARVRTVKSPALLGNTMYELLGQRRAPMAPRTAAAPRARPKRKVSAPKKAPPAKKSHAPKKNSKPARRRHR